MDNTKPPAKHRSGRLVLHGHVVADSSTLWHLGQRLVQFSAIKPFIRVAEVTRSIVEVCLIIGCDLEMLASTYSVSSIGAGINQ